VPEPLLLGVREAARELGIGRDSAYQLVRDGRLRTVRVRGRALVPRHELEDFCRREVTTTGNGAGNGNRPPTDAASRA
jgi:excisionase family DNA binding protein